MKRYKVGQVLKLLRRDGWVIKRIRGDHRQLRKAGGASGTVTVSGKESDVLSQEILNSIWKQAGWQRKEEQ
ncbi:MAG: type II toxin-antitoxin system HicA family toxin [Bacteroidales bacterium]|nr:type II toxin-antitoxin system HicA family toxin [Bacteroidales bacterium]